MGAEADVVTMTRAFLTAGANVFMRNSQHAGADTVVFGTVLAFLIECSYW